MRTTAITMTALRISSILLRYYDLRFLRGRVEDLSSVVWNLSCRIFTDRNGRPSDTEIRPLCLGTLRSDSLARRRLRDGCLPLFTVPCVSVPADHHFFPCLIAPPYFLCWIRVVFVLGRVVKMSDTIQPGSLRKRDRFCRYVCQLPVEIILRYVEQDFRTTVGINGGVLKVLASEMHVRHERRQMHIFFEGTR